MDNEFEQGISVAQLPWAIIILFGILIVITLITK